jgi:hypothetical protein
MNPMQTNQQLCGCGGSGQPATENRPLYQLFYLVQMLERQEEERRQAQAKKGGE